MKPSNSISRERGGIRLIWIILLALTAIGLVAYSFWSTGRERNSPPPPPLQPVEYETQIEPILVHFYQENAVAVQNLRKRINLNFREYRNGVPAFTDEILSFKARFNIVGKGTAELFSDDNDKVERYVESIFTEEVVGTKRLEKDLKDVLTQFHQDISASRNSMLSNVEVTLSQFPSSLDGRSWLDANQEFIEYVDRQVLEISKGVAIEGTQLGVRDLLTGLILEEIVRHSTVLILQKIASGMATTAATSGGATATTSTGGGASGALGGPAGAAIGFGVGLVAGVAIDWWMTDRLKEKLEDQCNSFLRDMQKALISEPNSLVKSLEQGVVSMEEIYSDTIQTTLVGGYSQ